MDHTSGGEGEPDGLRENAWVFLKGKKRDTDVTERFAAQEELLIHSVKFGEDVWMFPCAQT